MFCVKCGRQINDSDKFCQYCGAKNAEYSGEFLTSAYSGDTKNVSKDLTEFGFVQTGNLSALLKRGELALEDREWDRAITFFEQALNLDAESASAYWGKVLATLHCTSIVEFINYWTQRTEAVNAVEAFPADEQRIQSALSSYQVFGYLDTDTIRAEFNSFNRSFSSTVAFYEEQLHRVHDYFSQDRLFTRALQYASEEFASRLNDAKSEIFSILNSKLKSSQEQDGEIAKQLEEEYTKFLDDVEQRIHEQSEKAKLQSVSDTKQKECVARKKKIGIVSTSIIAVVLAAFSLIVTQIIVPGNHYKEAEKMYALGNYIEAANEFANAGSYKDAQSREQDAHYMYANKLLAQNNIPAAIGEFRKAGNFSDSKEKVVSLMQLLATHTTISGRSGGVIAIAEDGSIMVLDLSSEFRNLDLREFTDLVAVDFRGSTATGLKSDGTVVATSYNQHINQNLQAVKSWRNIISVKTGSNRVYGLRSDGKVLVEGLEASYASAPNWDNIIAIATDDYGCMGLRSNGSALAESINTNVMDKWSGVVVIADSSYLSYGLKADGTVISYNSLNLSNSAGKVDDWTDIVAISVGDHVTVGLKSDGTVVNIGDNKRDLSSWTNIVNISANDQYILGLKLDGTVVVAGKNDCLDQLSPVTNWTNVKMPSMS